MIKVNSCKYGAIYVEETLLQSSCKDILNVYLKNNWIKEIVFEMKRNSLKYIIIYLSNEASISKKEEINMHNQLLFLLKNKFNITNKPVSYIYEK